MPGKDGTGPIWESVMKERKFANCGDELFNRGIYANTGNCRRFSDISNSKRYNCVGGGFRRGFRNRSNDFFTGEKQALEAEVKYLEEEITLLKKRISEINNNKI